MWFVDILVDLNWFAATRGKLGTPRSRSSQAIPDTDVTSTFLLYGDDYDVRHLRVLIHTDDKNPPHEIVNANITRWVNLLEVATGLTVCRTATTASLGPNSSAMMVWMGEGDENAESCQLDPQFEPATPLDYSAAATMMAVWQPDFRVHLFYLSRFLDSKLPPEVRWLNGYRVLEWHFRRGKIGLGSDASYRTLLEQHGEGLDPLLKPSQDRKGLIEKVRALCAHSILSRSADPRNKDGSTNLITQTFQALEALIIAVMNEGTAGQVTFKPRDMPTQPLDTRTHGTPAV